MGSELFRCRPNRVKASRSDFSAEDVISWTERECFDDVLPEDLLDWKICGIAKLFPQPLMEPSEQRAEASVASTSRVGVCLNSNQ